MSSKVDYCRQIFSTYSLLVDFDGDHAHDTVPLEVNGESFSQWQARVLGEKVRNVRIYLPIQPEPTATLSQLVAKSQANYLSAVMNRRHSRKDRRLDSTDLSIGETAHQEVFAKFECLCQAKMVQGSHGFKDFKGMTIGDAAKVQMAKFATTENRNGAHILMLVVLSANRNFEKVVRENIERVKKNFPFLTLSDLARLTEERGFRQFKDIWGHADEKKYLTLKSLTHAFLNLDPFSELSDFDRMRRWAEDANLLEIKSNPIGKLKNVGIATFQHLRLALGIDTVKPDQRVIEVLINQFGAPEKIGQLEAVHAVEHIAHILDKEVAYVDQVFVKYGSGYYQKNDTYSCPE